MINRGSLKEISFIYNVAKYVCPTTEPSMKIDNDDIVYLGAGYWRMKLIRNDNEQIIGARLINPDRTINEIKIVEQSICILLHLNYGSSRT